MTRLRKMMLEELERRDYSAATTRRYLRFVERLAPELKEYGKVKSQFEPAPFPVIGS